MTGDKRSGTVDEERDRAQRDAGRQAHERRDDEPLVNGRIVDARPFDEALRHDSNSAQLGSAYGADAARPLRLMSLLVGSAVIPLTYLVTRTIFEDEREALRLAAIVAALPQLMMTVCHIGNIATRFFPGQQLHWSPQEERFTGQHADEANRHLSRPYRGPWRLEA